MPNWKKVVVSGSNVSQLVNDGVYLRTIGDGIISSSAQLSTQISGAFTATSAAFDGRINSISSSTSTFAGTGSNSFKGDQTFSGSLLPETSETFDLGSPSQVWDSLYVNGQSIYMKDTATGQFVTMSAANGVLTFNNTKISAPLGFLGDIVSSSQQIKNYNVFATTGSNTFIGGQSITGSLSANGGITGSLLGNVKGNLAGVADYAATVATITTATTTDTTLYPMFSLTPSPNSYITPTTHPSGTFFYNGVTRIVHAEAFSGSIYATNGVISSSAQLTTEFDTRYLNTTGDNVISSSAQIATDISGAFTAPSSSISTRITSLEGGSGANIYNSDGVVSANRTVLATDKTLLFQMSGSSQFLISDGPIVGPGQTWTMQVDSGGVYLDGLLPNTITSHIVGYNSVSTQLSYFPTSSINLTLDNVTDNGSTTTNGITIGGLTVNGNATITGTLTAQQFNTEFVSSSIIFESGSTKFGDSVDDIHSFTGSVKLNTETAATTDTDKFLVFDTGGQIKYRTGAEVLSDINPGGLISSSAQLTTEFDTRYLNTTGDGVISSSAQLTTEFDTRYLNTVGDSVISSSAQLTTEFDTRYLNTTGDSVISSSAQVTISSTTGYTSFSSSIAADIAALESAGYVDIGSGASGSLGGTQRVALWEDTNTIGGDSTLTYNNEGTLTVNGGTIRRYGAQGWSTGTVTFGLGSPVSCVGAFITYVIYSNDAGRSSFRAGNITAAWNNAGTTVTFNETTTTTIGTLPSITTDVSLSTGDMYVKFSQSSGTLYNVQVNVDTLGV